MDNAIIESKLSDASHRLHGQPMFKILAEVKALERAGHDIIHFEIGDPDFDTPKHIIEGAVTSLRKSHTHYVPATGIFEFKKIIQEATQHSRGFSPDLDQILVCPGANIIIYYAVACLVNPGEEVIVPDPGFPTYYSVLSFCGVKPIAVPLSEEDNFIMRAADIEKRITKKTKLIIINSPQNPTGAVIPKEELDLIYKIAKKHNIFLLSDEMYARIIYDKKDQFYSPATNDACQDNTIIINGFSKVFAMTGWRLGVAIGPEIIIEKMRLLLETTSSCVSEFVQEAGMAAIAGDQKIVTSMIDIYKKRRELLFNGINKINKLSCRKPKGALYLFVNIKELGMSSETAAEFILKEAKVAVLPGTNFGNAGEGFIRLSFCIAESRIMEGLQRLKNLLGTR